MATRRKRPRRPKRKYPGVSAIYSGGELLDICTSNWAQQLTNLATASLTNLQAYELNNPNADPNSVAVSVDGQPWASDWHFDALGNSVIFDVDLSPGQNIEVSYGIMVNCN